jgi:hypothetical protein
MILRAVYNADMPRFVPQCSPALVRLPACALLCAVVLTAPVAAPLAAQARRELGATTIHREPKGLLLARTVAASPVVVRDARTGWSQFRLEGWVSSSLLKADRRSGFDVAVTAENVRLREEPSGREIARLEEGMLLDKLEEKGNWTRVRRTVWADSDALRASRATAVASRESQAESQARRLDSIQAYVAPPAPQAPPVVASGATQSTNERIELLRATPLMSQPEGVQLAALNSGMTGRVVSRTGDWVRVQLEGWVREEDLKSASGALVGVTAAEIRANPERYVGQSIEWRLQYISAAMADELRPEMPPGQPYLLARGPLPETGFVYLMLSREDATRIQALPALTELTVRARVRAARSKFLATPVLQLEALVTPVLAH